MNAEQIKIIEETPDTLITLMNNEKLLVDEKPKEIITKVVEYSRAMRQPVDYLSDVMVGKD